MNPLYEVTVGRGEDIRQVISDFILAHDWGEGFIGIPYVYSFENLKVAIGRLADFVGRLKKEKQEGQRC